MLSLPIDTLRQLAELGGAAPDGGDSIEGSGYVEPHPAPFTPGAAEPGPGAVSQQGWPQQFRIDPMPAGAPLGMEGGPTIAGLPGRAAGGAVAAGQPVNVGEQGQEWFQPVGGGAGQPLTKGVFTPPESGTVIPSTSTQASPAGGLAHLAALGIKYNAPTPQTVPVATHIETETIQMPSAAPNAAASKSESGGKGNAAQMPSYSADQTGQPSPSTGPGLSPETATQGTKTVVATNSPLSSDLSRFELPNSETGVSNSFQQWFKPPKLETAAADALQHTVADLGQQREWIAKYPNAQTWYKDNPNERPVQAHHAWWNPLRYLPLKTIAGDAARVAGAVLGAPGSGLGQQWQDRIENPNYANMREAIVQHGLADMRMLKPEQLAEQAEERRNATTTTGADAQARIAEAAAQQQDTDAYRAGQQQLAAQKLAEKTKVDAANLAIRQAEAVARANPHSIEAAAVEAARQSMDADGIAPESDPQEFASRIKAFMQGATPPKPVSPTAVANHAFSAEQAYKAAIDRATAQMTAAKQKVFTDKSLTTNNGIPLDPLTIKKNQQERMNQINAMYGQELARINAEYPEQAAAAAGTGHGPGAASAPSTPASQAVPAGAVPFPDQGAIPKPVLSGLSDGRVKHVQTPTGKQWLQDINGVVYIVPHK